MKPGDMPTAGDAITRPSDFFRLGSGLRAADPFAEERNALEASMRAAEASTRELLASQVRMGQRGSALMDTARRLAGETTIDGIYRLGLDVAERQLEGAYVFIAHSNPSSNAFRLRAPGIRAGSLRPAPPAAPAAASFGAEVQGGGGATAALPDARYAFDAALLAAGVGALVAAPLAPVDGVLPVLVAAWREVRPCPREDVWFLEHLAAEMALAVRGAGLYSDLRQATLAAREATEQARRVEHLREIGTLASRLADDFNNALTSILGLADWALLVLPEREPARREVADIRAAASGMSALVQRLHDFCLSPEAGEAAIRTDPAVLAAEVARLARQAADESSRRHGTTFDVVFDCQPVPPVAVVPSHARQAWLHLVENALEAMPAGGQVTISCGEQEGRVRLGVADAGEGMAPEVRDAACDPFFTTKGGAHAGIGLAVARATAERYGGTLEIASEPTGGTVACLVFPACG